MYALDTQAVFMMDRVQADAQALARVERMLDALGMGREEVQVISDDDLPEVIAEREWHRAWVRQGRLKEAKPHTLVFNALNFDGREERVDELRRACPEGTGENLCRSLLGYVRCDALAHPRKHDQRQDCVCWSEHEFVTIEGCPHRCRYCGCGQLLNVMTNLEEFAERVVAPTLAEHEWQKCFRCNTTASDTLCFEPEYGLHRILTDVCADFGDRYLYVHSKSANVDFIEDLPHREHLIGSWSLTSQPVSIEMEAGAATALERLEAGRKFQAMGLSVRFKFKPVIPVRGWREQYAEIIAEMFRITQPEAVGFCVLMWMGVEDMLSTFPPDSLDPEYVTAAVAAAEEMKGKMVGPFPHEVRSEIYRYLIEQVRLHDKHVPLFISTESREMWDELGPLMGANPGRFQCGCGPICVPGARLVGRQTSTYLPDEHVDSNQMEA
ncbi:MAG: spore photoproduct lyase family protein [Armatimonadota bacterium]